MPVSLYTVRIDHDEDVVTARQRAGQIASLLGCDAGEQTRIATAVSEIVRNAHRYAESGRIEFLLERESRPPQLIIRVSDRGPGIPHLNTVLSGRYRSMTGMGLGISGARRLVDDFEIETGDRGTRVVMRKNLSTADALTTRRTAEIIEAMTRHHLVSMNGTAGHQARRIQEFQYPLPAGSIVVVHSDGLNSHWDLAPYPGLWSRHPSVIAGVLFRDFSRRRDGVTVVVMRARPAAGE